MMVYRGTDGSDRFKWIKSEAEVYALHAECVCLLAFRMLRNNLRRASLTNYNH